MVRVTGVCLGLLAFAVTIIAGLLVGNPSMTVLSRALWAMASFFALGCVLGYVSQRVIDEHAVRRHKELFGEPTSGRASPAGPSTSAASKPAGGNAATEGTGAAASNAGPRST
jgi:predicted lipid-binding transport protein (Tim44 family)